MTSTTVVTALIDPTGVQSYRNLEVYLNKFKFLAQAGFANLVVYINPHLIDRMKEAYGSIAFLPVVFEELHAQNFAKLPLPENRFASKDTAEYMVVINSKTELVVRAINDPDLKKTTHYCWIDFGIAHISQTPEAMLERVREQLDDRELKASFLTLPGCWDYIPADLFNSVSWRYCGGFFLGDRQSIIDFENLARLALRSVPKLIWEVNVWSFMEQNLGWKPLWYFALHDEGMFRLPSETQVSC
jgi:hypothetical protein